jgi:hypothetical protein
MGEGAVMSLDSENAHRVRKNGRGGVGGGTKEMQAVDQDREVDGELDTFRVANVLFKQVGLESYARLLSDRNENKTVVRLQK